MVHLIPVYSAEGWLYDRVNERRLAKLQKLGLVARVIRHRKGYINRAILFVRPGEKLLPLTAYTGTRYSFKEHLEHGVCWDLRRLGGARDGTTYAPPEVRGMFLQVVADCLVS